jgi:hypothetical protein
MVMTTITYMIVQGRKQGQSQKNFLPMVENPLDALFAHSQLQIRDNRNPVTKL